PDHEHIVDLVGTFQFGQLLRTAGQKLGGDRFWYLVVGIGWLAGAAVGAQVPLGWIETVRHGQLRRRSLPHADWSAGKRCRQPVRSRSSRATGCGFSMMIAQNCWMPFR